MFDIGWSEFVVIGVVALIVIGPKELPGVLRAIGHWTTKIRRMAGEFQSQFQEAMREAEMADLKKQVDGLSDDAKGLNSLDALDLDVTKWEPKTNSTPNATANSDSNAQPAAQATPDDAATSEAHGVVAAVEPAAADVPEPSPAQGPAASTSEPHPAVPLTEGNGRA
jgi:sec-independent protein translocase protein TatB